MALVNYPGIEGHLADRRWLKQEAGKHQKIIKDSFPEGTKELYIFLGQWLVDHIQIVDKQFSSCFVNLDATDIL